MKPSGKDQRKNDIFASRNESGSLALRQTAIFFAFLLACVWTELASAAEILVNGESRSYELIRAGGTARPAPLIIVLHGGKGGARQLRRYTDMDKAANRVGAVTVFADGTDSLWNDGRIRRNGELLHSTNDVAFLDALIDKLISQRIVDPQRIYFAGVSNGGMMSLRMSCESKHDIAGIAVIAASYPVGLACRSKRPVRVMQFIGTDDPLAPFAGGPIKSRGDRGGIKSASWTFDALA
jgi:polyhydroxybutyrate depolymerase